MLSLKKIDASANEAADYYTQKFGKEDYYVSGQEPPGEWRGGEDLGLYGKVLSEDLEKIFEGKCPKTGDQLVRLSSKNNHHTPGWDATFSAPKSVSLIYARASKRLRFSILHAHKRAVEAAISYAENEVLKSSVRRVSMENGERVVRREAPKNLIVAKFDHRTSRELDPQLHTHCIISNIAKRQDGTWGALDLKQLFIEKKSIGAFYRCELASILQNEMGYKLEKDREFFRVKYVPKDIEKTFSKRRQQILNEMNKKGWFGSESAAAAALITRANKKSVDNDKLMNVWKIEFDKLGWTELDFRLECKRRVRKSLTSLQEKTNTILGNECVKKAIHDLEEHESVFTLDQIKTKICEHSQCLLDSKEVKKLLLNIENTDGLINLGLNRKSQRVFTTKSILEIETRMIKRAKSISESGFCGYSGAKFLEYLKQFECEKSKDGWQKFKLSADQKVAAKHALSKGNLKLIEGVAGSGKSVAMEFVKEVLQQNGLNVIGVCPTGKASQNLQEIGIETSTLHRFFSDIANDKIKLSEKDVIIADELGMVGSKMVEKLLSIVEESGAKLIGLGEQQQLQPIDAGGAFRTLCNQLGKSKVSKIYRQKEQWQKDTVNLLRDGKAFEALQMFYDKDCLKFQPKIEQVNNQIIAAYTDKVELNPRKSSIMLAGTNEEVEILNQKARENLKEKGIVSAEGFSATVEIAKKRVKREFSVGDKVVFLKNSDKIGVKNGTLGKIMSIRPDFNGNARFLKVRDEAGNLVNVDLVRYENIDHGYAITVYKSQGSTVDNVFVKANPKMDKNLGYVAMSRHKSNILIFASHDDFIEDKEKKKQPLINLLSKKDREEVLEKYSLLGMSKRLKISKEKTTSIDYF